MDEDRYTTRRTSYLARITELRRSEAEAVAWSELGYSYGGIAKMMDSSKGTVKQYMQRAMALYGLRISEPVMPDEEPPDYERVGPEYLNELGDEVKKRWLRILDDQRDGLPQEWVAEIEDAAENEHGIAMHRL